MSDVVSYILRGCELVSVKCDPTYNFCIRQWYIRSFSAPLAPIFCKKKKESITIDLASDNESPPAIDPEKLKAQRKFLFSGVPEEIKKCITAAAPVVLPDYPPFPEISHLRQEPHSDSGRKSMHY